VKIEVGVDELEEVTRYTSLYGPGNADGFKFKN
jgi:hypothetical protein